MVAQISKASFMIKQLLTDALVHYNRIGSFYFILAYYSMD